MTVSGSRFSNPTTGTSQKSLWDATPWCGTRISNPSSNSTRVGAPNCFQRCAIVLGTSIAQDQPSLEVPSGVSYSAPAPAVSFMPGGRAAFLPATEARRPCVFKSKARKWWDAILATPSDEEPVSGMVDQEEPRRLTEQLNRVSFLRVLLRLTAANRIRLTNYTADHGAGLL